MKTLVIHPTDATTDMLSVIYDKKDWTIIRETPSKSSLKELIRDHDRIIMLGHGSPQGLIDTPSKKRFAVDSTLVYLLRDKKQCVYVWCNADLFVKKYDLKDCFYTGMIISEVGEAEYFALSNYTINDIDESNTLFSNLIAESIELPPDVLCENVRSNYITEKNNIILFNKNNIYNR